MSKRSRIVVAAGSVAALAALLAALAHFWRPVVSGPQRVVGAPEVSPGSSPIQPNSDQACGPRQDIDRETVLRALAVRVRSLESSNARLLDAQEVADHEGRRVALNVVYSTRVGLKDADALRSLIKENTQIEDRKRAEAAEAHKLGDNDRLSRLLGEIEQARQKLIDHYGLISYKISLSMDLPPILSFWHGLPYEIVRHDAAKALAEKTLGQPVGGSELVKFTSVSSLICFTSDDGRSVLIDPVNMREVPLAALIAAAGRQRAIEDPERRARIQRQWADFLGPDVTRAEARQ